MTLNPTMSPSREHRNGRMGTTDIHSAAGRGTASGAYYNVLPAYERAASDALAKDEVPPEYRAHVKDYFDSLAGGQPEKPRP